MAVKVLCSTLNGFDGKVIYVETDVSKGLPYFSVVGLAHTSVKESKERVKSAIINSKFDFPVNRIIVNLAPADIKKEGSQFDLSIAVGILAYEKRFRCDIGEYMFIGELSLNGEIKGVKGIIPMILGAEKLGIKKFIVPLDNVEECSVIKNIYVCYFKELKEVIDYLSFQDLIPICNDVKYFPHDEEFSEDISDVIGQESGKRVLEIAAAGGHNTIMFGPPGSGKTMLAKRIQTILPKMTYEEALEVTRIYSVSNNSNEFKGLVKKRPFRNPHHTITKSALVGGGIKSNPGEVSLAHHGVLYLDEIMEFDKKVLEVLRQPIEDKYIDVTRMSGNVRYPANFMLLATMNPCGCKFYGSENKECTCSDYERKRYLSRLSDALLDRFDLFIHVPAQNYKQFNIKTTAQKSKEIRSRVESARLIQLKRFQNEKIFTNSQMKSRQIKKYCNLDEKCNDIIKKSFDKYMLSARAYTRIIKVARTIADLENRESISYTDIIEALQYREYINSNNLDRSVR